MAIGAGDIVRLTVRQVYFQQECLNVFYYQIGSLGIGGVSPAGFSQIFWDNCKQDWRDIASSSVFFDRVIFQNLDGGGEFGEYVIPVGESVGLLGGEASPPFEAYAIQLNRSTNLTHHGQKRIVGTTETSVQAGGVVASGYLSAVQELADEFAEDLFASAVVIGAPVIVGFPNANRIARVVNHIDTATAKANVSTQSSRKYGHGS